MHVGLPIAPAYGHGADAAFPLDRAALPLASATEHRGDECELSAIASLLARSQGPQGGLHPPRCQAQVVQQCAALSRSVPVAERRTLLDDLGLAPGWMQPALGALAAGK